MNKISVYNLDFGHKLPSSIDLNSKTIDYLSILFNGNFLQKVCDKPNLYAQKIQQPIPIPL